MTELAVAAVIGSGIAAVRLSPHDVGLQLLENSVITGGALVALILALQPVSAAFNPIAPPSNALSDWLEHAMPRPWSLRSSPAGLPAPSWRT